MVQHGGFLISMIGLGLPQRPFVLHFAVDLQITYWVTFAAVA
jgi:hypothetical protein